MDNYEELLKYLETLFKEDREFFSGMRTKKQLGQIIEISNREGTLKKKAEKFLQLIRTKKNGS